MSLKNPNNPSNTPEFLRRYVDAGIISAEEYETAVKEHNVHKDTKVKVKDNTPKKKKYNLLFWCIAIFIIFCIVFAFNVFGHQGKTDSSGGHRDKNNVSGLGSYHYHCDGYSAHLHPNGICPHSSNSNNTTYQELLKKYGVTGKYANTTNSTIEYDEGYDDGYEERTKDVITKRKKETNFLLIYLLGISLVIGLVKFIKKCKKIKLAKGNAPCQAQRKRKE